MPRQTDIYGGLLPLDIPRYTVPEAAHHLRVPTGTVRAWIFGRNYPSATGPRHSGAIVLPADRQIPLLSFGNLTELHVLSSMRKVHGIRLVTIRRAVSFLKKDMSSEHPLIEREFMTDGKDLFIEHLGKVVNASQQGQMVFKWLTLYLDRIDRDAAGRPSCLYPFTTSISEQAPKLIAINPKVSFGKPCIAGTDIPTGIVAERFEAGDSLGDLAKDYGLPTPEIEEALRYEQRTAA